MATATSELQEQGFTATAVSADVPAPAYDINPFRGFVCVWIVLFHMYMGTTGRGLATEAGPVVTWCVGNLRLGFESFFVLAGVFLVFSFREGTGVSTPNFLRRRFWRLIIPYWLAVLLAYLDLLLPNLLLGHPNPVPSLLELAAILACIQDMVGVPNINFTHWSMCILIQATVAWTVCFRLVRQFFLWIGSPDAPARAIALLTWVAFAVSLLSLYACIGSNAPRPSQLFQQLPYLTLGGLTYLGVTQRRYLPPLILAAALLAVGFWSDKSRDVAAVVAAGVLTLLLSGYRFPRVGAVEGP